MPKAPRQTSLADKQLGQHSFADDFQNPVTSNAPLGWIAIIDTGATCVHSGGVDGGITITSDGTAEGVALYRPLSVQLDTKYFEMECTFQIADADDMDFQFGLSSLTAVTNPEDLWLTAAADSIAVGVLDGAAEVVLVYDKNNGGPVTQTSSIALSDATDHTIRLVYNQSTSDVEVYVDDVLALRANTAASIPDDLPLAPFVGARTGGDAAHTATVKSFKYYIDHA